MSWYIRCHAHINGTWVSWFMGGLLAQKSDEVAACNVGKLGSGGGGMCGACMMRWIGGMSRELDNGDELFRYYRLYFLRS